MGGNWRGVSGKREGVKALEVLTTYMYILQENEKVVAVYGSQHTWRRGIFWGKGNLALMNQGPSARDKQHETDNPRGNEHGTRHTCPSNNPPTPSLA